MGYFYSNHMNLSKRIYITSRKNIKMKKGVGMVLAEKVMKQGTEMCHDVLTIITCPMVLPYDTISRGVWPHI